MKKLGSRINGLKRTCRNGSFESRLMVANGIVMSKLVYLVTLWGGAQQYLLKSLLVQQLTAARVVCGFKCWGWSKTRLLEKVGWLSVRQLIVYHTVLQAQKTITSCVPRPLHSALSTNHPYRTRQASAGQIRFGEDFKAGAASFKYRAMVWYNSVPASVRTGSAATVKKKLKMWVKSNIPIDWD